MSSMKSLPPGFGDAGKHPGAILGGDCRGATRAEADGAGFSLH